MPPRKPPKAPTAPPPVPPAPATAPAQLSTPSVQPGGAARHVPSGYPAAQVQPADFRPHKQGNQTTPQTVVRGDPPPDRQAAPDVDPSPTYEGQSPTGYDPITLSTY